MLRRPSSTSRSVIEEAVATRCARQSRRTATHWCSISQLIWARRAATPSSSTSACSICSPTPRSSPSMARITIRSRRSAQADGDWIEIAVADTGIGMSEDQVERLFNAVRAGRAPPPRASYGGTGLGLALTRRMMQLLGGDVDGDERRRAKARRSRCASPRVGNEAGASRASDATPCARRTAAAASCW